MERVGGIVSFYVGGSTMRAKGDFTYNAGNPKREMVLSSDGGVAGYKETPQVPYIEGAITDSSSLSLSDLTNLKNVTVQLTLGNGKAFTLRNAVYASEGEASTAEGEIKVRFEGESGEEIA